VREKHREKERGRLREKKREREREREAMTESLMTRKMSVTKFVKTKIWKKNSTSKSLNSKMRFKTGTQCFETSFCVTYAMSVSSGL
jgi:hypothetical protein